MQVGGYLRAFRGGVAVISSRIKQKKVREDGADKLLRNVREQQHVLHNVPEERSLENLNSVLGPNSF